MTSTQNQRKALFFAICALLLVAPIAIMFLFPSPTKLATLEKISIALGFVGLTLAGLQFIPVSRLPGLGDALEMDKVYKGHHVVSLISIVFIALHPLLLIFHNPGMVALLNPFNKLTVWAAGAWGLIFFVLIGIVSAFRKEIKLPYTTWLIIHDVLAVALFIAALIHIFNVQLYMARKAMWVLWLLQAILWIGLTLWIRLFRPLELAQQPYAVKELIPQPGNTTDLYLVRKDGKNVMPFEAGQVAWIGTGSPFQFSRNPFSFAGSAEDEKQLRFSIKALGDFTEKVAKLKPGDTVYVDGPYGTCTICSPQSRSGMVLFGGGIGMAPIISILNTLADRKDERPVYVFYGDYNEDTLMYQEEMKALKARLNLTLVQVLEKPNNPEYEPKGYINRALVEKTLPKEYKNLYYFMCGPLPMMKAMEKILAGMQVPSSHIAAEEYEMA
ncbi:MAG: ferric reductase-like transmembrane domain-containing protein [Anaerolineaceae bacterium]|nr:ferric reductase-like transmembrane domain-containing protein [Anaerolineaceae bacterium]